MLPKSLSTITPKGILLTGAVGAVALLAVSTVVEYRQIVAAKQEFRRVTLAYDQCFADVTKETRKSGHSAELLDLAVDGLCPPKPSRLSNVSVVANDAHRARTTTWWLAGIVISLASLPWLVSLWRYAFRSGNVTR